MKDIGLIYDQLLDHESKSKDSFYPIHKKIDLNEPQLDLVDWILSKVDFSDQHTVLDAGCGTGNSLFRLHNEKGVSGLGISLSKGEIDFAKKIISKNKYDESIQFENISFDEKLTNKFDRIIAIESLKHSKNIQNSLSNLASHASDDGVLIIADDFLSKTSKISIDQKKLWNAPAFISLVEYEKILNDLSFKVEIFDLSSRVRSKTKLLLSLSVPSVRLISKLSSGTFKVKMDIYLGGLLLEKLYQRGEATYKVIIARKKSK